MLEELLEMGHTIEFLGRRNYGDHSFLFILGEGKRRYITTADTLDTVVELMYYRVTTEKARRMLS